MLAVEQMVLEKNEMLRNDRINEGIIQVAKEIIKNEAMVKPSASSIFFNIN